MFIKVKIDNLKASSKFISEIVSKELNKNREIIKIIKNIYQLLFFLNLCLNKDVYL